MTKPTRRYRDVVLPRGDQDAALAALRKEIADLQATENLTPRRASSKSKAAAKALEFDMLNAQAAKDATVVRVNELAYDEFGPLQDLHEPREGDELDKRVGYNRDTFSDALMKAALVEQDTAEGSTPEERLADLVAKGDAAFAALKPRPSRLHYARLESAAWEVNVGDDSLPKFSAVSVLKAASERVSKLQLDSE
jgi:hypothetical protein